MLGEHLDASVTEIKSWDVNFLEKEFPRKGDADKNLKFYEMDELYEHAQIPSSKIERNFFS